MRIADVKENMYPRCKHCYNRYATSHFLTLHMRRNHLYDYVTFIQQCWRFRRHLALKRAIHIVRGFVVRKQFLKTKQSCNLIKLRFLEYTYKPQNRGYKRALHDWNTNLKRNVM